MLSAVALGSYYYLQTLPVGKMSAPYSNLLIAFADSGRYGAVPAGSSCQ